RQEIHARIATALEQQFRSYWESNPEVLAHHLTESDQPEKAIALLRDLVERYPDTAAAMKAAKRLKMIDEAS
ncbi:MAG: hypothetical protein ACPHDL_04520, partial [Limisphaerales bacterium]